MARPKSQFGGRFSPLERHFCHRNRSGALQSDWPDTQLATWANSFDQGTKRIPNTAVRANTARQLTATVAVTHYFDLDRICRDCQQPFIFFAYEQKYWYEELGLRLEADCIRCVPCRKRHRKIADARRRYEVLFHIPEKTAEQALEMADCCLQLISDGVFTQKQTERIRMLLNIAKRLASEDQHLQVSSLYERVIAVEAKGG